MSLALLIALQSASAAAAAPLPVDFDLADVKPADPCAGVGVGDGGDGTEIRVCGRRPRGAYDLDRWAQVFETGPVRAEKGIAPGAVARAYTESVEMPGGAVSKRAMVGVKVKF